VICLTGSDKKTLIGKFNFSLSHKMAFISIYHDPAMVAFHMQPFNISFKKDCTAMGATIFF